MARVSDTSPSMPALWRRFVQRFRRARDGATAIEFAVVAFPFFLLLFAVLEVTYVFFVTTTLENATSDAARRIRTGELQLAGSTAQDFEDAVCDGVSVLFACDGSLHVDVRVYTDFNSVANPNPVSGGEFDPSGLQVDFGVAGDIVVVRVFYIWDVFTPDFGTGMANLNGGRRLIMANAAFRNEPFGSAS